MFGTPEYTSWCQNRVQRILVTRIARAEEEGIDQVVLDTYPPFDLKANRAADRALYSRREPEENR